MPDHPAARPRKRIYLTARYRRCWCGSPAMFLSRLCLRHYWEAANRGI
jgi:hypothetical protein